MNNKNEKMRAARQRGNAIVMLFAAIGMAGVVTYGLNNVMRGPATMTSEISRKTIAENTLVASTRLAIAAAANQPEKGDCDRDGFVEPIPFRDAGTAPAPIGGGLIPMTIGASLSDPWNTQYGYCVWDPGTLRVSDNVAACGGNTAKRLEGSRRDDQPAIAIISAGANGAFETTCAAFVDTTPEDNIPDTPMISKPANSDDIVLSYTYAEANGIGGGMWKLKVDPLNPTDKSTAEIARDISVKGGSGGTFSGAVELKNKGLRLPADPGDDSVTGPCVESKSNEMRTNISTTPPSLEICDFPNGNGWVPIGGGAEKFNPNLSNCTASNDGPWTEVAFRAGTTNGGRRLWAREGKAGDQHVYIAENDKILGVYSFNGTAFDYVTGDTSTNYGAGVWGDKDYTYASSTIKGEFSAYKFDGTSLTKISSSIPGAPYSSFGPIWSDGAGNIFVSRSMGGGNYVLFAFHFDGTTLTQRAMTAPFTNVPAKMWGRGNYVFVSGYNGTKIFNFNGSALTEVFSSNTIASQALWGDKDYIYIPSTNTVKAYTFNGTALTLVATSPAGTGNITSSWGDGSHLFVGRFNNGIEALKFDGTTFTSSGTFSTGDSQSFWGDGNYIYVLTDDGLRAFSGFECTGPNPGGGALPPPIPETPIDTTAIPDPLDTGLVSYWKMDDGTGLTVKDFTGTNNGAILGVDTGTPKWTGGAKGTGGLSFQNINNDAVKIPGLLGMPSAGTIAMWVNATLPNPDDPQGQSTLFSMGDHMVLLNSEAGGLRLAYYTGSTWEDIQSYVNIRGTGWQYVVATFDDANDLYRIYLNGILIKEAELTTPVVWTGLGADTWLGRHGDADPTVDFDGGLDDVRFYNRALSPDEVSRLTQRSKGESKATGLAPILTMANDYRNMISASSDSHNCGIKTDGTLWCWGTSGIAPTSFKQGYYLRGGNANENFSALPSRIRDQTYQRFCFYPATASDIPGGSAMGTTCTAGADGSFVIGANSTNSMIFYTPPGLPATFSGKPISAFMTFTSGVAATLSGTIYIQRVDAMGKPKSPEKAINNPLVTFAKPLSTAADVYSWFGEVDLGTWQTGDRLKFRLQVVNTAGTATTLTLTSGADTGVAVATSEATTSSWAQISAGRRSTCGIKSDGSLWCWGTAGVGSYNLGSEVPGVSNVVEPLLVPQAGPWTDLDTDDGGSCALHADGTAWCWGNGDNGRLGRGSTTKGPPALVSGGSKWLDIDMGATHACGIKADKSLWCWGQDVNGQLGNGPATTADQTTPVEIIEKGPWARVTAGDWQSCGIKVDGTAWCWGADRDGALGNGPFSTANSDVPTKVVDDGPWIAIATGHSQGSGARQHPATCAIKSDGSVWCWGGGANGALGQNSTALSHVPVRVYVPGSAVTITTGRGRSCAMLTDRSVWCWGAGPTGYLYNGSGSNTPRPVHGFPNPPAWEYDDLGTYIMPSLNTSIALRESWMSDNGTARGFGFISAGSAVLKNSDHIQLFLDSTASGTSAQVSFSTAPTAGYADVTSGLSGRWILDASSGTAVAAATGVAGTITGTNVSWAPGFGKIGGAVYFNGNIPTESFISVNRSAAVETAAVSVAFWMNRGVGNGGKSTIISKTHTSNTGAVSKSYAVGMDGDSPSQLAFTTGYSGGNDVLKSNRNIPAGQWVHVVATYDPAGSSPQKRIYINSVLDSSKIITNALVYDSGATGNLFFGQGGCAAAAACERYEGFLDEARIYNRALTETEIVSLYANQNASVQVPRSMGIDNTTDHLEFGVNTTGATSWMNTMTGQMQITSGGNVQVGTNTSPAAMAMLSVEGGVRVGSQKTCAAASAGTVRYTGGTPAWEYCNGTAWTAFPSTTDAPWKKSKNAISAADVHSCAILANGRAMCWGNTSSGILGENFTAGSYTPRGVYVHDEASSAGWSDWTSIVAARLHSCGIRANGTAWCWGSAGSGRLGDGQGSTARSRPVIVHTDTGTPGWSDWTVISPFNGRTCGVRKNGTAWCWGAGGAIGNNTAGGSSRPAQVVDDAGTGFWTDWVDISSGSNHTCGIRSNGTAWCWGAAASGNLGDGQDVTDSLKPTRVLDDAGTGFWTDWTSIVAANNHTCGLRSNGTAWCWGGGGASLGLGVNSGSFFLPNMVHTNLAAPGWSDWVFINIGWGQSCGIRANGTAWCWGSDSYGKLGNGATASTNRPSQVVTDAGTGGWSDWVTIDARFNAHGCGIRANGTAWCWGSGARLGSGTWGSDQQSPVKVLNPL